MMDNTCTKLLESACFLPLSLHAPNAWCGHLPFAAWLIRSFQAKIFVELGTHTGNSYFSFCQSVKEASLPTKCYAVDTWQGDEHAGAYSDDVFDSVRNHNQTHYAGFSHLLRMTFDDALAEFADGSIDLLHIDGLHTYDAVKHDFETWLPKLAPGAVVLFHDTNVHTHGFGVWQLWKELQAIYPNNIEFLHSHGLGVLQVSGAEGERIMTWLDRNSGLQEHLSNYFTALGDRQLERFELDQTKRKLADLSHQITSYESKLAEYHNTVLGRDEHISVLNQEISNRDQEISKRDEILQSIYQSLCWRALKPFRVVMRVLKRAVNQ